MKQIKVVHPNGGETWIPEIALPHHVRAGWRRAEELDRPRETPREPSPRRRRAAETSEES